MMTMTMMNSNGAYLLRGLPAPELPEHLEGLEAATESENGITEAAARLGHFVLILESDFLEGREGIRRQDLGPLVAVVARGVPAREDVAEAA